jgi:hypothetical protein
MTSVRLSELREQVGRFRQHLLPQEFDATGSYENQDAVRIRTLSFLVLAHAEIEVYLEDRIVEIAKAAWRSWKDSMHLSRAAFSVLVFCGREMRSPPESLAPPRPAKEKEWLKHLEIGERLKVIVQEFIHTVLHHNHGIREKNLLSMLLPIGIHHGNLDVTFVADIDSFGKRRGEAAHSSSSTGQVRQAIDPKTEYDQVVDLLNGLEEIDRELDQLLEDARKQAATTPAIRRTQKLADQVDDVGDSSGEAGTQAPITASGDAAH